MTQPSSSSTPPLVGEARTERPDARSKVDAAQEACEIIQAKWIAADMALGVAVSANACGIYQQPHVLRAHLEQAQVHIEEALKVLGTVDFPTISEYGAL